MNPVSFINLLRILEICSPLSGHRRARIFHKFVNLRLSKNFADQTFFGRRDSLFNEICTHLELLVPDKFINARRLRVGTVLRFRS